jgi:hypothetical protein
MAEQDENLTPAPLYLSQVPTSNGNIAGSWLEAQPASHSLFEVHLNPANPSQAALVPAPGADAQLLNSYAVTLGSVFQLGKTPGRADEYVRLERPTLLEKMGDNWKVMHQGRVSFSPKPMEQQIPLFGSPAPATVQEGVKAAPARTKVSKKQVSRKDVRQESPVVSVAEAGNAPAAVAPVPVTSANNTPEQVPGAQQPESKAVETPVPVGEESSPAQPITAGVSPAPEGAQPAPAPVGELLIQWQQKGDEVAPLLEMRAYLDQLQEAGVAVGALTLERDPAGKLSGRFGVSYDPDSPKLGQLEATLQGLKQVGHGIAVVEKPEQSVARRQEAGYDDNYEPPRSRQVREAFGVRQWDALSAQLSAVPKHALTQPEQVQQQAAQQRVKQVAQLQGKTTEQVLREANIDTSGNPASAFLKNFYAHLNGGPKTRQSLEVDYEQTRQQLQARLLRQAGNAPGQEELSHPTEPRAVLAPAPPVAQPQPAALFQAREVPGKVLDSLGLNAEALERSGQLEKLLKGQKTDLLTLQVAGPEGQAPVKFAGKMVLHRESDGSATLKLELPQQKLVIPNEIGGQPFTPEQRAKLETEGNAGLIRGLKDEQGREFNGYVAVDPVMNKVVVLPESKVTLRDTIAGVPLSPEQSHDLREGKAVTLANMASGNGGQKFDGTAQVNAAKACIEIRPAAHELQQRQTPKKGQAVPDETRSVKAAAPKATPAPVKTRGSRH